MAGDRLSVTTWPCCRDSPESQWVSFNGRPEFTYNATSALNGLLMVKIISVLDIAVSWRIATREKQDLIRDAHNSPGSR